MSGVYVSGIGLWSPGIAGPREWLTGTIASDLVEPACALLNPRFARRTSLLTRMCIEAFEQATRPNTHAQVPTVFGTTYGELETFLTLLDMLWRSGELSPSRFHNSVYNTGSGYLTMSVGNRSFSSTISAGNDTVAMAFLEAIVLVEQQGGNVVVCVADEDPRSNFLPRQQQPLAVAFLLSSARPEGECLGRIQRPRQGIGDLPCTAPAPFEHNPAGRSLPLLRALLEGKTGSVQLSNGWIIDVGAEG